MPFGSVDPRTDEDAIAGAQRQAVDLGARGVKYCPPSCSPDKVAWAPGFAAVTASRSLSPTSCCWTRSPRISPLKDAVCPKILKDNSVRLLGLAA